jgi:hypothetical protein
VIVQLDLSADVSGVEGTDSRALFEYSFVHDVAMALGDIGGQRIYISRIDPVPGGCTDVTFVVLPDGNGVPLAWTTITGALSSGTETLGGSSVAALSRVETVGSRISGASCTDVHTHTPARGLPGTCPKELASSQACAFGCASGYTSNGQQTVCTDGLLTSIPACRWTGNSQCWSGRYTFARCCDLTISADGNPHCWDPDTIYTFEHCCVEHTDCRGVSR